MKFIHISDLHLGKRLHGFSLIEDQKWILEQILEIVRTERPEAVLIAGDVYDRSQPSIEAVRLLDQFLVALSATGTTVCMISGNHDAPERVSFGASLMEKDHVFIAPVYDGTVRSVVFQDAWGTVRVHLLPFVKAVQVRACFPEEAADTITEALTTQIDHMDLDPEERHVLIAHQFVTGAFVSDSEDIRVGGEDPVSADVFRPFAYTALGHIHRPQNMGSDRVRYCGTPLKYSISEKDQLKSVTRVILEEPGNVKVDTIPLTPLRDVREIRGTYNELTSLSFYRDMKTDDLLYVVLTDENDVPDALARLRTIYPNIIQLEYDNTRTRSQGTLSEIRSIENKTPLELFETLYEQQNGQPMSEEQRSIADDLMRQIWKEQA